MVGAERIPEEHFTSNESAYSNYSPEDVFEYWK